MDSAGRHELRPAQATAAVRVGDAVLEANAFAAHAVADRVPHALCARDEVFQLFQLFCRELSPTLSRWNVGRESVKQCMDFRETKPGALRELHDGDPPDHARIVAAVPALPRRSREEAKLFVIANCRSMDARGGRHLANRQLVTSLTRQICRRRLNGL